MQHNHPRVLPGRRGSVRQRGAVIVEAAFIAPVVLFLLFAIVEGGNLLYANLSVEEMTGHAARTASLVTNTTDADVKILDRIEAESGASKMANIQQVVIYKAVDRKAEPTAACRNGTSSSVCSVYGPSDFAKTADQLSCGWCPADREAGELIGVWIEYRQPSASGILGPKDLSSQSVLRIEAGQ